MSPQQIGHLVSGTEHSLHVTRCPHGMKTMSISLSIHILQSFSLWSFCSFSSGSSSERKELQTYRITKTLLIGAARTTFPHYTSRFTMWRAIKTVLYEGPGAWCCLAELVQNHCFSPLGWIRELVLWHSSKNKSLFVCPYHLSPPKIHSDPNSGNKQKHL